MLLAFLVKDTAAMHIAVRFCAKFVVQVPEQISFVLATGKRNGSRGRAGVEKALSGRIDSRQTKARTAREMNQAKQEKERETHRSSSSTARRDGKQLVLASIRR